MTTQHDNAADDLRGFMRSMAATVTIITTQWQGRPYGMAATAVTSLSFEPASVLFCINHAASICAPLRQSRIACINALGTGAEELCGIFSGAKEGEERFLHGEWQRTAEGPYRLMTASASLMVSTTEIHEHGTHLVFRGDVLQAGRDAATAPLLYLDRQFGTVRRAG